MAAGIVKNPQEVIMGRIKSSLIKRTAKNLLKEENKFTESFEENKVLLGKNMPSKSTRNKIAGYISRLKRFERQKRAVTENQAK